MARKRVEIADEDINAALSQKAAKILGEDSQVEQEAQVTSVKSPISKLLAMKLVIGLLAAVLILGFIFLIKDRNQLKSEVDKLSSSSVSSEKDTTQQLVERLDQFIELPADETPTLTTISNVESLRTQAFFKNAQNGDNVLLYAKAGKAILYRPSTQKVIGISAINTNPTAQP